MAFGIYIHIPYCLQRCPYCDFSTYEWNKIPPPEKYVSLLLEEVSQKHAGIKERDVDTVYFGGGTPSLVSPSLLKKILDHLRDVGFNFSASTETTIEINPATLTEDHLRQYLDMGINRFSVGSQTFDDALLKSIGRKHSAEDTRQTVQLLADHRVSFSLDLLFALPRQSLDILKRDLDEILSFSPKHVSPYCLTVPTSNPLSQNRPEDETQIDMFRLIDQRLKSAGLDRYEISNYAVPGFESKHNSLYWADEPWWGVGLSAHSYSKDTPWGVRYWNAKSYDDYTKQIEAGRSLAWERPWSQAPQSQFEVLEKYQALTDYCHTALRTVRGLDPAALATKFGAETASRVESRVSGLLSRDWLEIDRNRNWRISEEGVYLSNRVFEDLTFLREDLA